MNTTLLEPFGLVVHADSWAQVVAELPAWIATHRVVVIRGLPPFEKRVLPLAARQLGPLQAWRFGAVNVLEVDRSKDNYLFTEGDVPLHWDGAFKGEIPNYLMFHCLEAPPEDAGGRTVFVDSGAIWADLDAATQQRWKQARFRYTTEKIVHYGGSFASPLVAEHPLTGATILRFAEPVVGLNPVTVEALHAGAPSVAEIANMLSGHRLLHTWQAGDVVLADNHALLHGREAFAKHAPRLLHRVNILDRARRPWQWLVDSIRIRRPEFMVAEVPINLLALLWIAPDGQWLRSGLYWEATAAFFLLFHFGDMVNCLADRELDAVYKTQLSEAVFGLGVRNVTQQLVVTATAAVLLTTHLAWLTERWWLVPLVCIGLVLGHQYSVGPLKLKSRGLWQIPTLWTVIFVGPMLLMTGVISGPPTLKLLAFIGLYGALAQSIILVNTAEDYDEDKEAGLYTSALALGRTGAVWTSSLGVLLSGAGLLTLFVTTARAEHAIGIVWFALGLWVSAWAWATLEIGHLAWRVRHATDPDGVLKAGAMKMPIWITVMAWLTLTVVGLRAWTS
jgi:alpha-ketoglutarate-dependent taurine dioxygenase/4-hydroxybenzoate polyprenyltransferase